MVRVSRELIPCIHIHTHAHTHTNTHTHTRTRTHAHAHVHAHAHAHANTRTRTHTQTWAAIQNCNTRSPDYINSRGSPELLFILLVGIRYLQLVILLFHISRSPNRLQQTLQAMAALEVVLGCYLYISCRYGFKTWLPHLNTCFLAFGTEGRTLEYVF